MKWAIIKSNGLKDYGEMKRDVNVVRHKGHFNLNGSENSQTE